MTADPDVLDLLRDRVDALHPPAALKAAVLRDLPRRAAPRPWGPPRSSATLRLVAGLAAAAALIVATVLVRRDGDRASRPPTSTPVTRDDAAIVAARARNVEAYAREKARLHRDLAGKWVVIAERDPSSVEGAYKPVVVGETLEAVAGLAKDAPHRFVFRVGDEGDLETFASEWYGPRFSGSSFVKAMGLTSFGTVPGGGIELRRGDDAVTFGDASPFPRIRVGIAAPGGSDVASPEGREVFFGTVGPTLMLTPEDDARLRLARWEVPGTETVAGVPCRRVLVRVTIPDLEATAAVVAAVPTVARETLVAMARERHRFWTWTDEMRASLHFEEDVVPAGEPRWVVFGNDRVLGVGRSPEAALTAADAYRDVVYHRYVTPWPRVEPATTERGPVSVEPKDGEPVELRVGTTTLRGVLPSKHYFRSLSFEAPDRGRGSERVGPRVVMVVVAGMDAAAWAASGLALGEMPDPPRVAGAPPTATTRAAWVRGRLTRPAPTGSPEDELPFVEDVLALVVATMGAPASGGPR